MGTYRTLFNALLYANELSNLDRETSDEWLSIGNKPVIEISNGQE